MHVAPHQKLIQYWSSTDADIRFGAIPQSTIATLEAKYDLQFPAEFRTYLLEACPEDDQVDHNCTEWWSLSRNKNIPAEYEHPLTNDVIAKDAASYLFFADFMIWSMAWAICCRPGENYGRVVVISGTDRFVANSFGDFVDLYIRDPGELL